MLRLLGQCWLEEVQPRDSETIAALPELAAGLPGSATEALIDLAVDYQQLFGFHLAPYESVFVDPSAMLLAPATARVQALYAAGNWSPAELRAAAPDHVGVELMALADWLERGQNALAQRMLTHHLALWVPALIVALRRLNPPPFYQALGELTMKLVLDALPEGAWPALADPFPDLPPPPVYRATGEEPPSHAPEDGGRSGGLHDLVARLVTPCMAGLYLTRADIAHVSRAVDLPSPFGDRRPMLSALFQMAGQYDVLPDLFHALIATFDTVDGEYAQLAAAWPSWRPYAAAWRARIGDSRHLLGSAQSEVAAGWQEAGP